MYHNPVGIVLLALDETSTVSNLRTEDGAQVVDVVAENGTQLTLFVSETTGLPTKVMSSTYHPFLGDVTVSRRHAEFTLEEGTLRVRDLGSTNGIYVNMVPVDDATLSPGDEVIIGKFHLIVVRGDA